MPVEDCVGAATSHSVTTSGWSKLIFCSSQIKIPRTVTSTTRFKRKYTCFKHTYLSFKFAFDIMFFTVISWLLFQKVNLKYNGPLFYLVDALLNKRSMSHVSGLYVHCAHMCNSKRLPHLKNEKCLFFKIYLNYKYLSYYSLKFRNYP